MIILYTNFLDRSGFKRDPTSRTYYLILLSTYCLVCFLLVYRALARITARHFINRSFGINNFGGYTYGREASRLNDLSKPAF